MYTHVCLSLSSGCKLYSRTTDLLHKYHNAPFCNRNVHMGAHFCYNIYIYILGYIYSWIFVECIVEVMRRDYTISSRHQQDGIGKGLSIKNAHIELGGHTLIWMTWARNEYVFARSTTPLMIKVKMTPFHSHLCINSKGSYRLFATLHVKCHITFQYSLLSIYNFTILVNIGDAQ